MGSNISFIPGGFITFMESLTVQHSFYISYHFFKKPSTTESNKSVV